MATFAPTTDRPTTAHHERTATHPVLDCELSRRLDLIISQLDDERRPLRRAYLRTLKLLAERHVPVRKEAGR